MQLEAKEEKKWASRAGTRASYFLSLIAVICMLAVAMALIGMIDVSPEGAVTVPLYAIITSLSVQIVIFMAIGHTLLLRGLFKLRKGYQLVPNVPLNQLNTEVWLWGAYAFGFSILIEIILRLITKGGAANIGITTVFACMCATQLIVQRMVKKGKAHIELTN